MDNRILTSLTEKMASFGLVPEQRPPASSPGSSLWPVSVLGLQVVPLPPVSDNNTISILFFVRGKGDNKGKNVKRKAEKS